MARTRAEVEADASRIEEWLDALEHEESEVRDSADLRRIGEAITAGIASQRELQAAVDAARARGRSWAEIAMVVGVTRQTAQQRFGPKGGT